MASSTSSNPLPSGTSVFTTVPDLFFIPEFIFGGLVWTLVASTKVLIANPQGWVMFVSVFCFIFTTLWFLSLLSHPHLSLSFSLQDVVYHSLAAFFYLSAAVVQAYVTISLKSLTSTFFKEYQLDIAAVVMCYVVTLLYALHAVFSTMRWKNSS
ncbi:myelin and lymphocyte protein-like [Salvelinus sp. IW2-2015]|uniref:myelin and lymphocyte protein-like n=1 Tax=Salvelinus sp. IW2-2015 TaxID=2691554 RepID=UPI000CDFB743|nr:myelin and lymphocyte protein-like [Salvelinus alpinus]